MGHTGRRRGRSATRNATTNSTGTSTSGGTARKQATAPRASGAAQARPRTAQQSVPRQPAPVVTQTSGEPQPAPELESERQVATVAPGSPLYQHSPHPHQPSNVNELHRQEKQATGFNTRVAVWLTKNVGTMQCAYIFAGIGIGSLVGVATGNVVVAAIFGSISSYFLQLVLLPILSVGQNVLGRHQELQADEMFKTTQRSFHDIVEIMEHLSAQDEELLKQTKLLLQLADKPAAGAGASSSGQALAVQATSAMLAARAPGPQKGSPQQ